MPKRTDIRKILVIGSGPIVIGQAAEFDYAGTQACLALKEEGYEVILCNSNPATIMTDPAVADKVYMEPLTMEFIARIVRYEHPDAILPGIGGQTALNLALKLAKGGVLKECGTVLLGTDADSIEMAEDRDRFKQLCEQLGEPVLPSVSASSMEEVLAAADQIGYPLVLRPAFTLGGTGGGFADNKQELIPLAENALEVSPVGQVLVEKSVKGFREIEYEVIRDRNDTAVTICNMENMDPVGIHTGDSIVVCPSQTLTNKEYQMLRSSALKIIRALKIEGGCNVQFALDTRSLQYYVIEVNPRVSRSSALASKASGYPIARVSAKIGAGLTLDEIRIANTPASFEPALDYVVTKLPRFPFDKFEHASHSLSTQMKSTGEVMSIGRCFEESLLKGIRSLESGSRHLFMKKFEEADPKDLLEMIDTGSDERIFGIAALLRMGISVEQICARSGIDPFFIRKLKNITDMEEVLKRKPYDLQVLKTAKRMGFSDVWIAGAWGCREEDVFTFREQNKIMPVYKMIDTCASEFDSYIPYFYSTYEEENESVVTDHHKIIVLGSGPIRIGQGVEFDYSTVHAVQTIRKAGYEAIIINNNPETVSTDYTCSDKLYFEPLCVEDVMNIIRLEKPDGVIVTLGGQTAINLAQPLADRGVRIIGSGCEAIDLAENRDSFERLLLRLGVPQPAGQAVTSIEEGIKTARRIGYPVLVRPSFVLGGRAMQIVSKEEDMRSYLQSAVQVSEDKPVLVDHYIRGKEVEVDAVCDGTNVFVPGIMELVERTGVHSGDSISVYPCFSLSEKVKETILDYTEKLGMGIGIIGLYNIQFIVDAKEDVYVIEVNPRSSRTVPFLSKSSGFSLADIGTLAMLGVSLRDQGLPLREQDASSMDQGVSSMDQGISSMDQGASCKYPADSPRYHVKVPAFSFSKLAGMDAYLSPEMKSTGEAIGYDRKLHRAAYKAFIAAGNVLPHYGTVLVSVADEDKAETIPLVKRFYDMGFNIEATTLTGEVLRSAGIPVKILGKPSEGSEEVLDAIRSGYVSYIINTRAILSGIHYGDGVMIRACAAMHRITMLTSLDTVKLVLEVLEEIIIPVSTI